MPKIERRRREHDEAPIRDEIRRVCSRMPDVTLMRNSQYHGPLPDGSMAKFGLGAGSPDLIGSLSCWHEHGGVSRRIARSLAIEVKHPDMIGKHSKREAEQREWLRAHRELGWITGFVTSVDEVVDILEKARRWEI